jgi:YHS domain-containing protein
LVGTEINGVQRKDCEMSTDLQAFSRKIQGLLAAAGKEPEFAATEAASYMAEWTPRRQQFDKIAAQLMSGVIRPRLEMLVSHFPQARLTRHGPESRCACWLGYTDRFPADVKIELSVEHDRGFEHVVIHSELYIVPAFIKYDAHDKLVQPVEKVEEQTVAAWAEERLLAAVDTYLQLDRGADDFEDEPVTDPVCGMRIKRSAAVSQMDYRGHPYFFCAETCCVQFASDPERYVKVVTQ